MPYLRRMLPMIPEYAIREAFSKRDVKMNGIRVGKDALVVGGAEVCMYTREAEISNPIKLIYKDDRVLVIVKPAGISCENDKKGGAIVTELAQSLIDSQEPILLCHRLDNPTDGLMVLCRDTAAQAAMENAFRNRQVKKTYTCLVKGEPRPAHRTVKAWLVKDAANARVKVLSNEARGAMPIITEYTVLEGGECSRLSVALHTGRTHQIRAQMAALGHPLLGDDLYGDREFNKQMRAKRLMLTSTRLSFDMDGELSYLNDKHFYYEPEF